MVGSLAQVLGSIRLIRINCLTLLINFHTTINLVILVQLQSSGVTQISTFYFLLSMSSSLISSKQNWSVGRVNSLFLLSCIVSTFRDRWLPRIWVIIHTMSWLIGIRSPLPEYNTMSPIFNLLWGSTCFL